MAIILRKEFNMFEVSEKAGEVIKQFIEGKEGPHSIRITLNEGG
jgi:Fe-S cluster assembly iron-binding protein IscA